MRRGNAPVGDSATLHNMTTAPFDRVPREAEG